MPQRDAKKEFDPEKLPDQEESVNPDGFVVTGSATHGFGEEDFEEELSLEDEEDEGETIEDE